MRKLAVSIWLSIVLATIIALFWYNEYRYTLPTPVPPHYRAVQQGAAVALPAAFQMSDDHPVFLHFFNPDCPCSRFNLEHFKSLVKAYQGQASFAVVVMNNSRYTEKDIQDRFRIDLPVSFDSTIAAACGVYSTPQAVILDSHRRLYYRGNYNRNRYCTDAKTSYAQMALQALLNQRPPVLFDQYALTAYGCQLPECRK